MKHFDSILLPLDGSPEAAKALGCACWLAGKLGATLHLLNVTAQALPPEEALDRLRVPQELRDQVHLHQVQGDVESTLLETLSSQSADLLVMSTRGASASAGIELDRLLGGVARAVMEHSNVPLLLMPANYREALPWESMLVAASGESSAERALDIAAQLATELGIRISVAHCVEDGAHGRPSPLGAYADAPHHEHPAQLGEIVGRGLQSCSQEQCRCIEHVALCIGEPAEELPNQIRQLKASVLALGWHGALGTGRAPVLKRLLEQVDIPILLFKESPAGHARLKVGEELDHA